MGKNRSQPLDCSVTIFAIGTNSGRTPSVWTREIDVSSTDRDKNQLWDDSKDGEGRAASGTAAEISLSQRDSA